MRNAVRFQHRQYSKFSLDAVCLSQESLLGFEDVEEELVENIKGSFVHLKWIERNYPVEITDYPWDTRDVVPYSSVTRKPMKRLDISGVKELLRNQHGRHD